MRERNEAMRKMAAIEAELKELGGRVAQIFGKLPTGITAAEFHYLSIAQQKLDCSKVEVMIEEREELGRKIHDLNQQIDRMGGGPV
jgi:SMC interacting uncharacterized protein involved in chromosome segregation